MRIGLCCDFFLPRLGGVETHIWSLAQELHSLGHHVVILAIHERRRGVRLLHSGQIRAYYLPFPAFAQGNSFPGILHSLPLIREIILRERLEILHAHQATSALAHQCLLHGRLLGVHTVFTEHSLFQFGDPAGVNLNKVLKFSLAACDAAVAVSEACRENLVLRTGMEFGKVVMIPNAVDPERFFPLNLEALDSMNRGEALDSPRIKIVVISRLAYRKGVDLVARIVPMACARWPNVDFIIGGGGPKRLLLDEMVEKFNLGHRVELLGEVPHDQVRSVLIRGKVFLNCSLTEAFCIAILEAACAGLVVVSTKVGGVPEVLPADMIHFPREDAPDLINGLVDALGLALERKIDGWENHRRLAEIYSWNNVARKTVELVYEPIMREKPMTFFDALSRYRSVGPVAGVIAVWLVTLNYMFLCVLRWIRPDKEVDLVPGTELEDESEEGNES